MLDVAKYSSPPPIHHVLRTSTSFYFVSLRLDRAPPHPSRCSFGSLTEADSKSIFSLSMTLFFFLFVHLTRRSHQTTNITSHFISTRLVFFGVIFRLIPLFAHFTFVSRERSLLLTFILPPPLDPRVYRVATLISSDLSSAGRFPSSLWPNLIRLRSRTFTWMYRSSFVPPFTFSPFSVRTRISLSPAFYRPYTTLTSSSPNAFF